MRSFLLLALLLLPAVPALAADDDNPAQGGDPSSGFPKAIITLIVVASVFALVWRTMNKRKQGAGRD